MKRLPLFFCILWYTHTTISEKIALISIPKCGTYLLMNCVEFITQSDGVDWPKKQFMLTQNEIDTMQTNIFAGHFLYNAHNKRLIEKHGFTAVLIIRDPRDQCVSMMHWLRKHPMTNKHIYRMDDNALLSQLIVDQTSLYPPAVTNDYAEFAQPNSIADFYQQFLAWRKEPYVHTVTFESLVGAKGGGNKKLQEKTITDIIEHLNIQTDVSLHVAPHYIYGHSMTFRKGKIGSWKEHFTQEHKTLFKQIAGQLLIDLGYETDFNW